MKTTPEDNAVMVLQQAIRIQKIRVTNKTIKISLLSHPHYPTLKSICDLLKEWKIDHYPIRYDVNDIKNIDIPFIAHLKDSGGQFAFVSKIENNRVHYYMSYSKKIISINDFIKMCTGAIIIFNATKESGEKEFKINNQNEIINKSPIFILISILIFYVILQTNSLLNINTTNIYKFHFLIILSKLIGIILSLLLVLQERKIHTYIGNKLCHINKQINCNAVLNDKSSLIFGWFGWADLGIIYFISGFLLVFEFSQVSNYSFLAVLSTIVLPYTIFSIAYQGIKLKIWCPLCLGVQLIFFLEFLILSPYLKNLQITLLEILNFSITFFIIGIIHLIFNLYLREKAINEIYYYKYLSISRNPKVFNTILLGQNFNNISESKYSLIYGSEKASIKITAFLSIHCTSCKIAFKIIREMLETNPIQANFVVISTNPNVLNSIYYLYLNNRINQSLDLLEKYFSQSESVDDLDKYDIPSDFDIIDQIDSHYNMFYKDLNVTGTPTFFINGYQLPSFYDIRDIVYLAPTLESQIVL